MNNCIFCKIIGGEIPSYKIYEDEKVFAFLDINPVNPGHTLVVPKEHHETMTNTPDELLSYMNIKSKELMETIKKATNADYVALSVVGLDVPHFHIHIIPRYHNDGMEHFWPTKQYKEGKAEEIAEKIKNI